MMAAADSLGWVDWTLLVVLLASVLVGLWRGLVFELLSLVGWLVAYVLAQVYSPQVAQWFAQWLPAQVSVQAGTQIGTQAGGQAAQMVQGAQLVPGAMHQAAAFAATFVAVLVTWTLLARLVRLLIHATPLTLVDRTLGAGFGLLRGALLLLVVATLVALTPASRSSPWQASQGAALLGLVLHGLKPVLPAELARHLPA